MNGSTYIVVFVVVVVVLFDVRVLCRRLNEEENYCARGVGLLVLIIVLSLQQLQPTFSF